MTEFQQIAKIFKISSEPKKLIESVREFLDDLEEEIEIEAEQEARGFQEAGNEAVFLATGRGRI